jgi:hypothetical protein
MAARNCLLNIFSAIFQHVEAITGRTMQWLRFERQKQNNFHLHLLEAIGDQYGTR